MRQWKKISTMVLFLSFLTAGIPGARAAEEETEKYTGTTTGKSTFGAPQLPKLPARPPSTASYIPASAKPSVIEIQKELEQIVQIHRSLEAQHRAQIMEIQRITEQARAHQKLLKDLSAQKARVTASAPAPDIDEAVRLQKIRLIQEKARENRKALEEIQMKEKEGVEEKISGEPTDETDPEKTVTPSPEPDPAKKKKTFWW